MKMIVGIGNPGNKYEKTRHNVGFMVLDKYAQEKKVEFSKSKFGGTYVQTQINGEKVILLKPEKYVNLSGEVVREFIEYFKISIDDILVIHDDLDLELGSYKLKASGGSAGHNGISNIILHLASDNFKRFKVGISKDKNIETSNYVLSKFSKDELDLISEIIDKSSKVIDDFIKTDFLKLMNKSNK